MQISNTPKEIDSIVIDFCKTIVPTSTPEYIKLRPEIWCRENQCYDNVDQKVRTHGGRRQLGWRIQVVPDPLPKCMIEAVHHAIWISDSGEKIDITPQPESSSSIVFLEDNNTPLGAYRIGEKYQALVDDEYILQYVKLCQLESSQYVSKTKLCDTPAIPQSLLNEQNKLFALYLQKYQRNEK